MVRSNSRSPYRNLGQRKNGGNVQNGTSATQTHTMNIQVIHSTHNIYTTHTKARNTAYWDNVTAKRRPKRRTGAGRYRKATTIQGK